jgi:DNA-binding MarR family transcriptional regulator
MRTKKPELKYFLCSLTSRSARRIGTHYNRILAPMGLTAQQVTALGLLWKDEGLGLGEFAHECGIGKASAVTMIDRLEAMGLVERRPHPRDARLKLLYLTKKARGMAPRVAAKLAELEKELEKALGPEKMAAVADGLTEILALDILDRS